MMSKFVCSLVSFLLLLCMSSADVSPFYAPHVDLGNKSNNERALKGAGLHPQDRQLGVGNNRFNGGKGKGGKGKPKLGKSGRGKGGSLLSSSKGKSGKGIFKSSSKGSSANSASGKGGKGGSSDGTHSGTIETPEIAKTLDFIMVSTRIPIQCESSAFVCCNSLLNIYITKNRKVPKWKVSMIQLNSN